MDGRTVYTAGDALSPSPMAGDSAAISAWIPRAQAWMAGAQLWRAQATISDPWIPYVNARLDAVQGLINHYQSGAGLTRNLAAPVKTVGEKTWYESLAEALTSGVGLIAAAALLVVIIATRK